MARIPPLPESLRSVAIQAAFDEHIRLFQGRITNMKATLGHSLLAFDVYMQWYPLYKQVIGIVGDRAAYLYAYSISTASDCPLCSTFFRKIIIDAGEDPENLKLSEEEKELLEFGSSIARAHGNITDESFDPVARRFTNEELVILIAFAGQMIATNVFNNVIKTEIDGYLSGYLAPEHKIWQHEK